MPRYVALLRGINVSGHNIIKMEDLRNLLLLPYLRQVSTYIQSGNVLFESDLAPELLEQQLSEIISKHTGKTITVVCRNKEELQLALKNNPILEQVEKDELKLHIGYFQKTPSVDTIKDLNKYLMPDEVIAIVGKELYFAGKTIAKSKITNQLIEKKAGSMITLRNLATTQKLIELLE